MELISRALLLILVVLAAVLLFTPYEAWLEGAMALAILGTVVVGFSMPPRKEIFYVRTSIQVADRNRNPALEHDFLAVKVELARLWLLFLLTFLAVAFLVFFAAGGPTKFSYTNWILSSGYGFIAMQVWHFPPLLALVLLLAWVGERRVMRDAEACSARSYSISRARSGPFGQVSYLFMGERGEYYGGDCMWFGLIQTDELATIVFHNVQKPELNKIAMGFLFHRLIVLGRGVADLDAQTVAAHRILAETIS